MQGPAGSTSAIPPDEKPLSEGFNASAWAVRHPALVLFMIIALALAGGRAYLSLGRAEDPSFTIKTMVMQVFWPGATAEEIQAQVANPIEKKLQELPAFDFVRTYSRPGVAVLQLNLRDSTRGQDVKDAWYQVRKKIGDIRSTLPQGVVGPVFNDEYGDVFSAVYMLTSDGGASLADLKRYAESLRQSLLRVPDVTKIELVGETKERIFVEFSYKKLATLGITPQAIFESLQKQNTMTPAGSFETASDRILLRVTGSFTGVDSIAAVPIESGGRTFRLGDIAEVRRGYEDPPRFVVHHRGKPALGLAVAMLEGGNVLALGENLKKAIEEAKKEIPTGISIEQISDQPKVVEESVGEFLRSFGEALVIVLIVSFLSLGWRTGIVVGLSVPLVLAIVFVVMAAMGMNLDRITLGSLIIALGLLVDDAIIAIEMMVVKMEEGYDRFRAATFAWSSTAFPMLTGTLVTAAGFLPVGFAKSTAGEYAGGIFWVVGLALIVSWVVAVVFTPYLGFKLLPKPKPVEDGGHHDAYDTRLYRALRRLVTWSIDHRGLVIAATFAAFGLAITAFGFVQQQFFPTSSRPELFIEVRMPEGSTIGATGAAARKAEALLKDDKDALSFTTYVGQGSPRFFLALNPVLPNDNFALVVIMTPDAAARDRLKARLVQAVDDGAVPEARVRIDQLNFGPPVGFPVQFRVSGPDPLKVREIAYEVREAMRAEPRTRDVQLDWNEQVKRVQLVVDQDRARAIGTTPQDLAQILQTLVSGFTVTEYREGVELIEVVARATASERLNLDRLEDIAVPTRSGQAVPLSQVARISYGFEEPILWRRNRDMVLTVRSDIAKGVQAPDVTNAVWPLLAPIVAKLPVGYRIEQGGAIEESAKANVALFKVFPVMFLVMLTLLMIQLQSFSKLFLVFSTAPLGLIGASFALLAFNAPFGFVALLGLIALAGMIMRNTVILVDQIDIDMAAGRTPYDAIVESTVRRARPVVLTALAAILGMIPLARSVFWGPMSLTIMGGLFVATLLTLVFLPALYAAWFRVRKPAPAAAARDATAPPASALLAAE
ncbi:MAG: efflux RND transporter permease subunit [Hyphomicrobiaceae bacterium]|nr:efflux RND transporter permease subunit [Hyphomicrobiaceae bacterium]